MPKILVRRLVGVALWLGLVLNVSITWLANAQQQGAAPARGVTAVPAEAPNFVGKTATLDATNISGGRRLFESGARSNWHSHPNGQLILNESGVGLHQIQGKPITRLARGESIYVGPGVVHWHGAAPDSPLTQVSIGFGGTTSWGAAVTEAEYRGR
jgi:quercetin dioxygenase-like cupin family protein